MVLTVQRFLHNSLSPSSWNQRSKLCDESQVPAASKETDTSAHWDYDSGDTIRPSPSECVEVRIFRSCGSKSAKQSGRGQLKNPDKPALKKKHRNSALNFAATASIY
ncbi:hypothetical protein GN956_G9831 [Arapaima gigas]